MFPVCWWGTIPPELTTSTTSTKTTSLSSTTTTTTTVVASSASASAAAAAASSSGASSSPPPTPSAPHENPPSQVCSEKHRGVPSAHIPPQTSSTSSTASSLSPSSSHNTILLLYETCRRYLTISQWLVGETSKSPQTPLPLPPPPPPPPPPSPTDQGAATSSTGDSFSPVLRMDHKSEVAYLIIQGCNIVQIMPTPPSPSPAPSSGETEIRSNSPQSPSFCSVNSSDRSSSSPSSSSPLHPHFHSPSEEDVTGALPPSLLTGWRRDQRSNSSSNNSRSGRSRSRNSCSSSSSSLNQCWFLLTVLCLLLAGGTSGSELPDRECCDSVPPPPPNYHHATSTTTTTTTPMPRPGFNNSVVVSSHGTGGVMNCIEARHQCLNEKQCGDVLSLLNKICGPELVACATTTPTKCKMLLRTLGTFDYLTNCICSEPHLDFTCHSFREIIFNHPCTRVETSEFSLNLMPNCNDAYGKCNDKASCVRDYLEFVKACTFNDITCTAQESEKCYDSWSKIRHSPVFGCVCSPPPTSHMRAMAYGPQLGSRESLPGYKSLRNSVSDKQQMCMATYNSTHENPCLAGQQDLSRAGQVELSQATCHMSLEKCQSDPECRPQLEGMMVWCEHSHCEPDRCRMALQEFYDRVSLIHRLRVAFCVCRQSDPDGECLTAMRKLHPTCAERHSGRDPLKCHKIEDQCRTSPSCSKKLEEYEQKCAADSMTGRCADTHRSCQMAVMNILGTELHATCVCKGTDFLHQHDCYTWQKLLWSNPCVIESHLMLHKEIAEGGSDGLDEVFRRPTIRTTPAAHIAYVNPTEEDEGLTFARPPGGGYGTLIQYPDGNVPRPSGTYGHEHIRPWDNNRRTGGVFIGRNNERNGGSSRGRDNNQGLGRGSSNRGLSVGRDRDRSGQSGGSYDISKGLDSSGGTRDRNRGGSVDRGYVYPEIISSGSEYPERSKGSSGRNPEGGLSVAGNGGRNGGGRNGQGSRGSGRRYEGSRRVPILNGNRNVGGRGTDYSIDQTESGGYGSHGRGSIGPGHRGTKIKFGPQEGGSGSMPSGRDWNNIGEGRRPGRPGGSWAEFPDKGGAGGLPHFPVTRPPHRRPVPGSEYEPMPPPAKGGVTPTPPALPVPTTQSTTTTPIPTTTIPRKTCTIKNAKDEQMANLQIAEGEKKRIYNTSDCSALCECRPPSRGAEPEAMCVTLRCIDNTSCNTERAKFPHSAPFYLAYRGVCDCYAGKFICQKPDPKDYNLGPGVYMFLGYSKGEMEILKPFTSKNELDALTQMEEVLVNKYNFSCTLDLKHHIGENVIAISQLRITPGAYLNDFTKQQREKRECARPLQQLAEKINVRPRDVDILMDAHLSMFILAEVEVNFPEAQTSHSSASDHLRPDITVTYLVALLTLLFLHHHRHYLLLHRRRHLQLQLQERMVPLGVRAT